ncbi:MAG TPA: beta-ketoacyl synthase N-terminal-like domain-containing protein, partial [Polyangiales bacterium]|nr:beta-ketoacyl synthase N-terminal-like domain-containing protein [Polyangiales bacterium]
MNSAIPARDAASLVDIVERHAVERAEAAAFSVVRDELVNASLSFAQLRARACAIAARLQQHGLVGQPVLVLCPPGLDYVCSLLGAWYAGAIAVPAYPPTQNALNRAHERIATIVQDTGARAALTTSDVSLHALPELDAIECDRLDPATADAWVRPALAADTPCLLQYTSGSTSTPRGVMITHRNLLANQALIQASGNLSPRDTFLTWLPPYHDMGLIGGIVAPMYNGAHGVLMAPDAFIRRPVRWLRAIGTLRATIAMAPNFALDLCLRRIPEEARADLDLSSLRLLYNGAEPINPASIEAFHRAFGGCGLRREAMHACYGLAEATLIVSSSDPNSEPVIEEFDKEELGQGRAVQSGESTVTLRRLVSCGRALGDVQLRIVDPQTRSALPEREIGEIWIRSATIAAGYWKRPEDTEATFGARLDSGEGPFLRTGDLGFLLRGELFVTGRRKDLIIVHGVNHYPHDLERTVQRVDPALLPDCGVAFAVEDSGHEQLVIVQELDHRLKADAETLMANVAGTLRAQHGLTPLSVVLIKKGSLLKTASGKVRRRAMRELFERDELAAVARWQGPVALVRPAIAAETVVTNAPAPAIALVTAPSSGPRDSGVMQTHLRARNEPNAEPAPGSPLTAAEITELLCAKLVAVAGVRRHDIDERAPLAQYGVDSLIAAELTDELEQRLGRKLPSTITYDNPSVFGLSRALAALCAEPSAEAPAAPRRLRDDEPRARIETPAPVVSPSHDPIAIVGMACRFPGAPDLHSFWDVLRLGVDAITEVPESRWNVAALYDADPAKPGKMSSRWGGFLPDIDRFDPRFFGISPREAERMDPQQRLFLEVTWEALEDAGIAADELAGTDTGVFAGAASSDYALLYRGELELVDADYGAGNAPAVIANRVSYFLDLKGPSVTFDTACSSSLVALQAACRSLQLGDASLCLVGGVNAVLAPEPSIFFSKARALARDGRCKTFDATADGFVRSEGCGVIVLKKLSQALADRDRVYALVAGTAVNHDGASNGLMAPNGPTQERLLQRALKDARLSPRAIDYIETHGVGAPLADVVEARAIGAVMQQAPRDRPCLLGSVKTNVGHLEAASGIAGVIKTALALTHEEIPPHLHLHDVHPDIGIERLPLAIATLPTPWRRAERVRYAGVSAFGFGGTNAHVILGEAPEAPRARAGAQVERPAHVLALSARDPEALAQLAFRYSRQVGKLDLGDLCFTANAGRAQLRHRATFVASSAEELRDALEAFARAPLVNAAEQLSLSPRTRELAMVFPERTPRVACTRALLETQPVFRAALEHADALLAPHAPARLLDVLAAGTPASAELQVDPQVGCIAVQYALHRLLASWGIEPSIVCGRGIGELTAAAASGALAWEDALRLAAHRSEVIRCLKPGALVTRTLHAYKTELQQVEYRVPRIPFVSGTLERTFAVGEIPGANHWRMHLYNEPDPDDGLDALEREHPDVLVTVDPSQSYEQLLSALGDVFTRGFDVHWRAFDAPFARSKLSLPSYPFARQR